MCVYLVMCSCDLCYVGSTRSKLRICMTELKSKIRNAVTDAPMVQHFLDQRHSPESFKLVVWEIVTPIADKGGDINKRLIQRECFWIYKLKTIYPKGLNTHLDFSAFL